MLFVNLKHIQRLNRLRLRVPCGSRAEVRLADKSDHGKIADKINGVGA